MTAFHEVRFPLDVALGARGGPERATQIIATASGREERVARWAHARRKFDAGFGVKSFSKLAEIVAFFEERRGRLYGFRFRDRLDFSSAPGNAVPTPLDQNIGTGDGITAAFALSKGYGQAFAPYRRPIEKPVAGSVRLAVNGVEKLIGTHADLDAGSGRITFRPGHVPADGASITAGFLFDVPVRFDTDYLEFDLSAFEAGVIQSIPLIEIRV
jgi:uncharacterized protein (TIGR02217 family)